MPLASAEEAGRPAAGAEAAPLAQTRRFLLGVLYLQAAQKLRDPEGSLYPLLGTDTGLLEVEAAQHLSKEASS